MAVQSSDVASPSPGPISLALEHYVGKIFEVWISIDDPGIVHGTTRYIHIYINNIIMFST